MPNYDFVCEHCGHEEERMVRFEDRDDLFKCPMCQHKLHRQFPLPHTPPSRFPYVHHNLAAEPVTIQNRAQEKHEFASRGLEDGR